MMKTDEHRLWLLGIDMGYGHLRALYPFHQTAEERIFMLGEKETSALKEQKTWKKIRSFYEFGSRVQKLPIIGKIIFSAIAAFQKIEPLYPDKDLSSFDWQLKWAYRQIKKGTGSQLAAKLRQKPLPVLTSYTAGAMILDYHKIPDAYFLVTDTDIPRICAVKETHKTEITYFAPCSTVVKRLKQYGVPEKNIHLTGFPFPDELTGGESLHLLKQDLSQRITNLDLNRAFITPYRCLLENVLGQDAQIRQERKPVSISFAVGGAGAQAEIGLDIAINLKNEINKGTVKLNLIAGTRKQVLDYYYRELGRQKIKAVRILYHPDRLVYMGLFSSLMRETDILWTKPSELSFYTALGIPIVIAPPIGLHEKQNRDWIIRKHAGIVQPDPKYTREWLFDYLQEGFFARLAFHGFMFGRQNGKQMIEKIIRERLKP